MPPVPEKIFVNLYPKGVGASIGTAYDTKTAADAYANSHRIVCLELSAEPASERSDIPTVTLDEKTFLSVMDIAIRRKVGAGKVIKALLQVYEAIPNEIRAELHSYAGQQNISFGTAVAEACRAYMTDAAR